VVVRVVGVVSDGLEAGCCLDVCAVDDENKSPTRASREAYIQGGEVTMAPVTIDRPSPIPLRVTMLA
jgi:hypothetical protein